MLYRFSLLLSSFVLAAIFAVIGWNLYGQINKRFDIELAASSTELRNVYTVQNETLARRTQALAYSIASNTETQRLLVEATEAVRIERTHNVNDDGPRATHVRRNLQEQMKLQWNELHARHEVQHLQFLLPDGTSFLRMDAPARFGDNRTAVRPMLADIVQDHKPHSGFEIEHTYAGMLGMVMAMRVMPDGSEHPIGIVEVGFDMRALLNRMDKQLDTGVALLLDSRRVFDSMQENYRPAMEIQQNFILMASRPEAGDWLKAGLLPANGNSLQSHLFTWKGQNFQLITFALDDYQSQLNPQSRPSAGTVLIWRDITGEIKNLNEDRATVVINTLTAWVFAQFFLLALLYVLRREWKRQLKQSTATIEKLLQHNSLLLDTAANGIWGIDSNGTLTFINRAALAMHGYQLEEVMGKNPHELFHHHDPDGHPNPEKACLVMQTVKDGKPRESEEWLFRRDGSYFPAKVSVMPFFEHGQRNGAVIVFHDITEQRNRQEALLRLATTDSLTGASNRRHFLDQLETELARQHRHGGQASILMTDLDFFKRVNDEYGHAYGDAVLNHFVYIVHQTVRRSDVIGRLGGEEFAILLPGVGMNGARELAERLRRTFENSPVIIENTVITCTVSIGISDLRTDDMTADAPLRRADEALYAAKAAGRNRTELHDPNRQYTQSDPGNENTGEER